MNQDVKIKVTINQIVENGEKIGMLNRKVQECEAAANRAMDRAILSLNCCGAVLVGGTAMAFVDDLPVSVRIGMAPVALAACYVARRMTKNANSALKHAEHVRAVNGAHEERLQAEMDDLKSDLKGMLGGKNSHAR